MADEHGIPWQGKIPTDVRYYHEKIRGAITIMGYGMYQELSQPLVNSTNFVATKKETKLRDGFIPVADVQDFLRKTPNNVWVLGGALLFSSTLHLADELYLTQLDRDFNCTKFFPQYENNFVLVQRTEPISENGIAYTFGVWQRKDIKP